MDRPALRTQCVALWTLLPPSLSYAVAVLHTELAAMQLRFVYNTVAKTNDNSIICLKMSLHCH